ncbi:MAG: ATP-binding cassette domain-containing protein [Bryobacteraceae bacterium]|jgi:phospholipid/cholesterol/gamma-HCH transport system ATP-binding protein
MEPQPVVVKGLQKSFGQQQVLKGVDLAVDKGEILAILGKSGTGKSVLLRLLIGLEKADAGSICIRGQETTNLEMDALNEMRMKVGFLFQEGALYDSLTIAENVAFPLRRHTKLSDAERNEKVRALLLSVGLDKDLEKMPSDISGGMRKRVGLARALALDPEILLFDEPTAGLDPITAADIGRLIQQLRKERGVTSIVVTHDMHAAHHFSDRIVMLKEGNILISGTFEDLEKSKDPFVAEFLSDAA